MANSPHKSSAKDFALQKYLLLSAQQEALRKRLFINIPSEVPMSPPPSPQSYSLPPSPTRTTASPPFSGNYPASLSPVSSHPSLTMATADSTEEEKLFEVNHQIKATLTELINCESVKHDTRFRLWVQSRLMDAEKELKRQRRRRSSVDKETAYYVAGRLE